MHNFLDMEKNLNSKIVEGCWKAIIFCMVVSSLVYASPLTNSRISQFFMFVGWMIVGVGIFSYLYKTTNKVQYTKYYVNLIMIFTIVVSAITLKNPETFSAFYFLTVINMTYRDRTLHFVSSAVQLVSYISATLAYPILLPAATTEDSSASLFITRITIFIMVTVLVDILNSYNRQLTQEVIQKERDINLASLTDSVGALVQALEAKDLYTNGHSHRTSKYSLKLARKLIGPNLCEESFLKGCLLHDIGKIGMPDHILTKQGPLDEKEYLIMKEHPVIGARILETAKSLRNIVPMVIYHHERYDGKGYPRGLKGEEIPMEARILAVADAYDAMTSDRPYREAYSSDRALEEIVTNSGTQFCPQVVKAFQEIYEELHLVDEIGLKGQRK